MQDGFLKGKQIETYSLSIGKWNLVWVKAGGRKSRIK